jgi:transposase
VSSVSHRGFTHLGLDVSKDSIAVAVLDPDRDRAPVRKIFHDEESVRRLIGRFEDRSKLWACYEAGPTGYELYRLLDRLGVRCDVIAPALIPKQPGNRVKTDKRDASKLAGLRPIATCLGRRRVAPERRPRDPRREVSSDFAGERR